MLCRLKRCELILNLIQIIYRYIQITNLNSFIFYSHSIPIHFRKMSKTATTSTLNPEAPPFVPRRRPHKNTYNVTVIGTVFGGRHKVGDFDWMIKSGNYDDSLFIFNDDVKRNKWKTGGKGNSIIRKYNKYANPRNPKSVGIVTGRKKGFTSLTDEVRSRIDKNLKEVVKTIQSMQYRKVYYSAKTPKGLLGTGIFKVGKDVLEYITHQIHELEKIDFSC